MKIIIAGYGFVGKAVGTTVSTKHRVLIVDPNLITNKCQKSALNIINQLLTV